MASMSTCFNIAKSYQYYTHSLFTSKPSIVLKPSNFPARLQTRHFPINARSSFLAIRASVRDVNAVTSGFNRPGGVLESDKLPIDVRKRAMGAVDACGLRVTIGDVARTAGLQLDESQKALQALASDTNGFLEVSDEGDVLYAFPKDYRSKLAAKSFRIKFFEPSVERAKLAAENLIRFSFATALIASIIVVCTSIFALLACGKRRLSSSSSRYRTRSNFRSRSTCTISNSESGKTQNL